MDNNTFFTATHEWVKFLDDTHAEIGITDYAQHALGDIVFVNLPEIGDALSATQRFGDVESVKAVSDLISPVDGVVSAVNDAGESLEGCAGCTHRHGGGVRREPPRPAEIDDDPSEEDIARLRASQSTLR